MTLFLCRGVLEASSDVFGPENIARSNPRPRASCLTDIALDRVRAGVVSHPAQWDSGGYHQVQSPPTRYRIIDRAALAEALGVTHGAFSAAHAQWVDTALRHGPGHRACQWTTSLAVGSREFVERIEPEFG